MKQAPLSILLQPHMPLHGKPIDHYIEQCHIAFIVREQIAILLPYVLQFGNGHAHIPIKKSTCPFSPARHDIAADQRWYRHWTGALAHPGQSDQSD